MNSWLLLRSQANKEGIRLTLFLHERIKNHKISNPFALEVF